MRVLDLFSGIGGFSLGFERAGFETVAFCEIDPWCRKVLRKHWPDVPIFEDVTKLKGEDIEQPIDLICGGYPCQPFSVAGQRKGKEDDRHLWPEFMRLVAELRPSWIIGENVAGHITMGLDDVLSDLESEGYTCRAFVIPAVAIDAKHKRNRVWILAHANSISRKGDITKFTHAERRAEPRKRQAGSCGTKSSNVCDTTGTGLQNGPERALGKSRAQPEFERPNRWPAEPGVGRVAHGIPHRVDRIRGLGNAVVPQIPEIFGKAIMEIEGRTA